MGCFLSSSSLCSGLLWFDCAPFSTPGGGPGVMKICPTPNATWEACAPVYGNFTTKSLE